MPILRWLLVVPILVACVYAGVILFMLAMRPVIDACMPQTPQARACLAPWYPAAEAAVTALCTALAILLGTVLPTLVAPTHKRMVAFACTIAGLILSVAILVMLAFPLVVPVTASLVAGVLANWFIARRLGEAT